MATKYQLKITKKQINEHRKAVSKAVDEILKSSEKNDELKSNQYRKLCYELYLLSTIAKDRADDYRAECFGEG